MDEPSNFFTGRTLDKLALIDRGNLIFPPFLLPCRLKILMVVDGYPSSFLNVSFSHSYFGLSAVLDTLRENPEYFVKFDITRAHRQTDSLKPNPLTDPVLHEHYGPHYEGFRFTQMGFDIDDYDQVWLFGARADENDTERLTDEELEVLARWMDQRQGGLFATGDHADLGAALCARVPRARSMRRWSYAQGVPQPGGPDRHDTNLKGHDSTYTFDDESDDIPMKITPRFYPLASFSPFESRRSPHPLLCGTGGVIDVLPDHPHEGWVYDDADVDLTRNISFGSYNAPEYPTVSGVRPTPEMIAQAHVQSDHTDTSDTNKGAANAKTFGAIGAYDGHRANVGRVVVDSTWHHWFDVNLTGRPDSELDSAPFDASNPKTLGYLATPAGRAAFSRIQNYFRNVALWLASPPKQSCMFFRATWGGILRYPAVERLHARLPIWELGESARDAIGRRAGQCTLRRWIEDLLSERFREMFRPPPFPKPHPCLTCPPFELLEIYVMGGVTRQLLELAYSIEDSGKVDESRIANTFASGLRAGVTELTRDFRESLGRARSFSDKLAGLAAAMPNENTFLEMQPQRAARAAHRPQARKARKARRRG